MKKDIIVFGCGRYYKSKKNALRKKYRIVGYLDNNAENLSTIDDIPVRRPGDLSELPKVSIMIMADRPSFIGMYFQLRSLNVSVEYILFGLNEKPAHNLTEKLSLQSGAINRPFESRLAIVYKNQVFPFANEDEYKEAARFLHEVANPYVRCLTAMPADQGGRAFGGEFGTPIDRYYIERFLKLNSSYIHGDVMEVAESTYTYRFGSGICNAYKLHINGGDGCIKGNLETGEGILDNAIDCFICTQTLQFIYDIHSAIKNIHKLLRPGGTALITAHGISQIAMYSYRNWGEYWRFTEMSLRRLMEEAFDKDKITILRYGNMKTAMCFLYGLCQENLEEDDFEREDEMFQFVLGAVCVK
ncbi:MAG: methyltransferase domain-containing protein [Selenomonas sp.]|nr:methyltransferase domain-containing protein [Selenomonas sp.]